MAQHYSDTSREHDPHSLPDIETFYHEGEEVEPGWYYWHCFPGCLPDSEDAIGPFATEAEALSDARENS